MGPSESLVLTPDASTFDSIWGTGLPRYQLANFPNLANSPSATNETVAIVDRNASIRDQVNYDDEGAWPRDNGSIGHSISVRPEGLSAAGNDQGALWTPTLAGVYGGRYVNPGGLGQHQASPGVVGLTPQAALAPSNDAAWSLVVLPDTQNYAKDTVNRPVFSTMTGWIRDHADEWGIQAVLHEGDIVNNNDTANPSSGNQTGTQQWQNARAAFDLLDNAVPYVLATGNHDHGTTNAQNRQTQLNDFFSVSDNPLNDPAQGGILGGTMVPDALENAYYDFTAPDGRQMLILSLEWGPRQASVDWANAIAARPEFADHTAVLLTHAYMYNDETRYFWPRNLDNDPNNDQGGNPYSYPTCCDTHDGEDLWNELVSEHESFEFVFSGHVGGDGLGYLESTGSGNQAVHQMLFNTQFESHGGNGWLRVLEFLEDGQSVRVRTVSPLWGLERMDAANRFVLDISPLPPECDFNHDTSCDIGDLNLLLSQGDLTQGVAVGGGNEPFDLTGDGVVDGHDLDAWLADAASVAGLASAYKRGDANLDGIVDGQDFIAWNNSKFSATGQWDHGDFNGDDTVDGQDFIAWNANKFTSSLAVPEPAAGMLILVLAGGVLGRLRDRRSGPSGCLIRCPNRGLMPRG